MRGIVIYCGAGATIDFTGLNWEGLNSKLIASLGTGSPSLAEATKLLELLTPIELSSILEESYSNRYENRQEARSQLYNKMQSLLYQGASWERGKLAIAIVAFASKQLRRGIPVTILTTNQDTFIESVYQNLAGGEIPGISSHPKVIVMGDTDADVLSKPAKFQLKIVYLHGQVPRPGHGEPRGVIPNGEREFALRLNATAEAMRSVLESECSHFLAVGTSLRDAPMVKALTDVYHTEINRYILLKHDHAFFAEMAEAERSRLIEFLKMRTEHLRLEALYVDFYCQFPQFFFDLSVVTNGSRAQATQPTAHSQRLNEWAVQWKAKKARVDAGEDYRLIREALDEISQVLPRKEGNSHGDEALRLELWHREPITREIVLYAHTGGEIRDRGIAIRQPLEASSGNCSVESLIEGRPVLKTAGDFERARRDRRPWRPRWRTFFSVPILTATGNGVVFSGSVTLCSMAEKSVLEWAKELQPAALSKVRDIMTTYGERQFTVIDQTNPMTQSIEIVRAIMPHAGTM